MDIRKLRAAKRVWDEISAEVVKTSAFQKVVTCHLLDVDSARLLALHCRNLTRGRVLEIEDPTGFAVACMGDRYQLRYPGEEAWVSPQ